MKAVEVRERIERAARLYASNQDARRALGIAAGTFGRLCRQYEIETPHARRHRRPRRMGLDADEFMDLN